MDSSDQVSWNWLEVIQSTGAAVDLINIHSAKMQLYKLIKAAERGEEVIIAWSGKPVAKLVALQNQKPARKAGSMRGLFEVPDSFFEPLPENTQPISRDMTASAEMDLIHAHD